MNSLYTMRTVLLLISFITVMVISIPAIIVLPRKLRGVFAALVGLDFLWIILVVFAYPLDTNFWGWFFDSSAEHTGGAIMMSTQLMLIGVMAILILWHGGVVHWWQRLYWLVLAGFFIFLGMDEFYSFHETFDYWRITYMLLGGGIVSASIVVGWRSDTQKRRYLALFVVGFGLMGFGGVYLDAFSNTHTVGPIPFTCSAGGFLGVSCQRYGMLEEFYELLGGTLMLLGVLATMAIQIQTPEQLLPKQLLPKRLLALAGTGWLIITVGGYWLLPTVQSSFLASPMRVDYLNGRLSLVSGTISHDTVIIGDTVDVTLYMRANEWLPKDYFMSVTLISRDPNNVGQISHDDMELGNYEYPTYAWIPGLLVRNDFHLTIPSDAPTNVSYRLVISLWRNDFNKRNSPENYEGFALFDEGRLILADIPVLATDSVPPPPTAAEFHFENEFSLDGYGLPNVMTLGDTADAQFWWSVEQDVSAYWWQFLHFFDTESDQFYSFNQELFHGAFPTGDWPAGMNAVDSWSVMLPEDMLPGTYRVQTGMFQLESGVRASVIDKSGQPVPEQSIILGTVEVRTP